MMKISERPNRAMTSSFLLESSVVNVAESASFLFWRIMMTTVLSSSSFTLRIESRLGIDGGLEAFRPDRYLLLYPSLHPSEILSSLFYA